jgi:hypothetical protein
VMVPAISGGNEDANEVKVAEAKVVARLVDQGTLQRSCSAAGGHGASGRFG